jgi:hypothetical protein
MIAADFLRDPTGTGLDMPSQTHRASGGLTAGSCGPFRFGCNKSAAIIPFVNETLTGGLPIGSGGKWLMKSV